MNRLHNKKNDISLGRIEESVKCIEQEKVPLGVAVKEKCRVY